MDQELPAPCGQTSQPDRPQLSRPESQPQGPSLSSLQTTATTTTPAGSVASETDLEEINLLLDMIRSNLSNIARTWGRESSQYRSAKEIMQAYLSENVERLRGRQASCPTNDTGQELKTTMPSSNDPVRRMQMEKVERGIEELMNELKLD